MSEITINLHNEPCSTCAVCVGRRIGVEQERERIIKQLQREIDFMYSGVGLVEHHHQTISFLEGFIELIKGETK